MSTRHRTGIRPSPVPAAICMAALLMAACTGGIGETGKRYLTYRMPQDPPTLDPHDAADENSNLYVYNIFDGLVEFAPGSLEVVPAVAASWEISEDLLTYTFRLREGVLFHDGREVAATDVVYSLHRILEKGRRAAPREALLSIEGAQEWGSGKKKLVTGITSPDPRTVVVRLTRPTSSFLSALATQAGSIVPRELYGRAGNSWLRAPVGCGPFMLEEYSSGRHLKLAAFARHWKGAPKIPGVTVRIIPDVMTALLEYRTGGLDITNEIPSGRRGEVQKELGGEYRIKPRLASAYILINHASGPLSSSPALRRALGHAINRERLVRDFQEGKDIATSWILPPDLAGGSRDEGPLRYDPAATARLLTEAGYPGGKGLPAITFLTQDNESIRRWADGVQNDLVAAGFEVDLQVLPFGAYVEGLFGSPEKGPSADLIVLLWFADYPDPEVVLQQLFRTGSGSNFSRYSDEGVDRVLDEAARERDPGRRLGLYLQAEKAILDDGGVIALYHQGDDLLAKPGVTGLHQSPLGDFAIPLELVELGR